MDKYTGVLVRNREDLTEAAAKAMFHQAVREFGDLLAEAHASKMPMSADGTDYAPAYFMSCFLSDFATLSAVALVGITARSAADDETVNATFDSAVSQMTAAMRAAFKEERLNSKKAREAANLIPGWEPN